MLPSSILSDVFHRFCLLFSVLGTLLLSFSVLASNSTSVITNKSCNVNALSSYELHAVFSLRQQFWDNGLNIQLVTLRADHPDHKLFTIERLGIQPFQLQRLWSRRIFQGLGKKPIIVDTPFELIQVVTSTPGAIGYVNNKFNLNNDSLKVHK